MRDEENIANTVAGFARSIYAEAPPSSPHPEDGGKVGGAGKPEEC